VDNNNLSDFHEQSLEIIDDTLEDDTIQERQPFLKIRDYKSTMNVNKLNIL
jgi:hypothetical protein